MAWHIQIITLYFGKHILIPVAVFSFRNVLVFTINVQRHKECVSTDSQIWNSCLNSVISLRALIGKSFVAG